MRGVNQNPLITLVCGNVYPLFSEMLTTPIGGMETRAALFARGLLRSKRWQVRFVVNDFGQPDRVEKEGIEFHIYQAFHRRIAENVNPRFSKYKWFPILNLDKHDLELLWQIPILALYRLLPAWLYPVFWRKRRTHVVLCFGNNAISAQVVADCFRLGIKTVLCIAADSDLAPDYRPEDQSLNDYATPKWMAHYALETADHIFVQTESQQRALAHHFGRQGQIIRNPVHISTNDPASWPPRDTRDVILWIGRSDTFHKRPLLVLQLARRCPDIPFLMIVNKTHTDVFEKLQAECPPNLIIVEQVLHNEIWEYYRRARVFVSTSAYEGFPNTFLQCAVAGVPVVSLDVDPEGILSQKNCGLMAAGNFDIMEDAIRNLWTDHSAAEKYARTFHSYALDRHGVDGQIGRLDTLLQKVIDSPPRSSAPRWWHLVRRRFVRTKEI